MNTLLEVTRLRKAFGSTVAVDGVSFSLPPGGALGLVGESGSGKTTTARMLVGLERPDSGSISVLGRPLAAGVRGRAARLARAKAVQMVYQDPYLSLDARLTIGETLDGVLRLHGHRDRSARAARVRELLAQVGLGDREAAARPRGLSGASASAPRSPAPSRSSRRCWYSTRRSPRWTSRYRRRCSTS